MQFPWIPSFLKPQLAVPANRETNNKHISVGRGNQAGFLSIQHGLCQAFQHTSESDCLLLCPPPLHFCPLYLLFFSISLASAQSIRHHFYLPHYMCLPASYLPNCYLLHMHTHTPPHAPLHSVGLWFWGSYDTIQILAAYSRKMCFALKYFPLKSRFSLPYSFDPHGTGGRRVVSTVLCFSWRACQTPTALSHCSVMAGAQIPLWSAIILCILYFPKSPENIPKGTQERPNDGTCKNIPKIVACLNV